MESFFIRGQTHVPSLCSTFQKYFQADNYTDLTLVCENNRKIFAHKLVLCGCSSFVKHLCTGIHEDNVTILLPDVSPNSVNTMLQLLYGGSCEFSSQYEALDFLSLVSLLGVDLAQSVRTQLENYIQNCLGQQRLVDFQPESVAEPEVVIVKQEIDAEEHAFESADQSFHSSSSFGETEPFASDNFLTGSRPFEDHQHGHNISDTADENDTTDFSQDFVADYWSASNLPPDTESGREHQPLPTGHLQLDEETPGRSYRCTICDRTFSDRLLCVQHARTHTPGEQLSCNTCHKLFPTRKQYKAHMQTHDAARKFHCPDCGKAFRLVANLQRHRVTHTGAREFTCDMCPAAFNCKSNLARHIRRHTGERPYQCWQCSSAFNRQDLLRRHMVSQHETSRQTPGVGDGSFQLNPT